MCSIAGLLRSGAEEGTGASAPRAVLAQMMQALRHRGPDDEGVWISTPTMADKSLTAGLANTRLAILDLSVSGHQPMFDAASGLHLTYNGECYNYRELRRELGNTAGEWQSQTDTEVVLRAFGRWGQAAFGKLRGMFALALWDETRQTLVLARDPFGIKPLYYYHETNHFVFASELRALLASELVPRRLSKAGLTSYLHTGSVIAPETIIEGVRSITPGHYVTVEQRPDGQLVVLELPYADHLFSTAGISPVTSREEAVTQLRELLEESVRLHLVSDVPLGLFLSGGIDSSALVALMGRVTRERPKTFSVVFAEEKFTEATQARMVAEKFNTEHTEVHLNEERLLNLLPAATAAQDQPTMDGINTYVVAKAVKEAGITVALSGLGGDELFAGYATFQRALRLRQMARIPSFLRHGAATLGRQLFNGSVQRNKLWQLVMSDGSPAAAYAISRQLFSANEIAALYPDSTNNKAATAMPQPALAATLPEHDPINAISLCELRGYMANTLLRDTDFMSMAHSLEVRVPFVDAKVAGFVLGLPGAWKLNGGKPKPLLLAALGDLLPANIMRHPKMGFTLPFEQWMQSRLRPAIEAVFADDGQFTALGIHPRAVNNIWRRFLRDPQGIGWSRPWALYILAGWCKRMRVTL
jgi:asparagine synthase (glutamine-hydrolysing)